MYKQRKNLLIVGLIFCAALILSINICYAQQNPFITNIFLADPSAHVWNDGRLYVYPSHDIAPNRGCDLMDKYHVYSTDDMINWTDHGEILNASQVPWGRKDGGFMWAPDCAYKNGIYYFYFPHPSDSVWNSSWKIGIATSTSPDSGFTCQGYIPDLESLIDPQVFQDDDGQFYFYYGGGGICKGGKLKDNMMEIDGTMQAMSGLVDFHEATWVFKRNGIYYLTYADNHSDATGDNRMRYAISTNPLGPWTYQGVYMDPTDSYCAHGSVIEYKGQWYQFYFNSSISHNDWLRSVCFDKLYFNDDGTIQKVNQTKSISDSSSTNLLGTYNGSFESGMASWRFFEVPKSIGSTAAVDTVDVAQGTKAIKLTLVPHDSTLADRALDNWDANVGVAPRQKYTASVKAKTPASGILKLRITFGFFDNGRNVISEISKDSVLTSSYQTFSVDNTAPANASTCWIAFRFLDESGKPATGTLFLDDAEILGQGAPAVQDTTYPADPPLETGYNQVDRSTLTNKVMCGYQGWFAVPTDPINRGWYHYNLNGTFAPGSCKFDLWPDMSDMGSDEKYLAPGFARQNGMPAFLFSAQNRKTVIRHFKWMADYGIDGVFIQRFAGEVMNGGAGLKQFNNVLANCKAGAHEYGRTFAVMYDLSGIQAGDWKKVLADWRTQIVDKKITKDSCYLFHNGKPVVALWGIGFNDGRQYTLAECNELIDSLKNNPEYGGNTVMIGVPKGWRTLNDDAVNDTLLTSAALKADIISPWYVGRFSSLSGISDFANTIVSPDVIWCKKNNKDYIPVVFPGFSWHNMNPGSPLNQIPRLGGNFLWSQYYNFMRVGAKMLYQAMFDEIDEGTAIFKCTNDPPVGASNFVTYEGLPSDQYLWLVGQGERMLKKEISLSSTIPTRPTGVDKQGIEFPGEFKLEQNYPNPFNPTTTINYSVPKLSHVTIKVYDSLGREVSTLLNAEKQAGNYSIKFNISRLASGIYFYKMQAGDFIETKKLILLK